jgi:diacylglycerol kinase (ATP)
LEVCLALVLAPAALLLGNSAVEKVLLLLAIALVLLTEMLNSAVEAVVDRVGPEYHELSKQAKDMGSAAVFISLATFVAIWGLLLL